MNIHFDLQFMQNDNRYQTLIGSSHAEAGWYAEPERVSNSQQLLSTFLISETMFRSATNL